MADPLNNEVEQLLQRTGTLLRSSTGGDRTPSENGRSERQSIRPSIFSRGRASISSVHSSTELDGSEPFLEAAGRARSSFKRSVALQKTTDNDSDAPTPRLQENLSRPPPSIAPTEPGSTALDHSGPTSLNLSLTGGSKDGRAYNSFGGLHEMVSMVDAFTAPAGQPAAAGTGAANGSRLSFATGPFGGGGVKGSASSMGVDLKPSARMRSPSRLGSPAPSPRSPLHKTSSLGVPVAASTAKVSRRTQLQALLGKDIAQPQDVIRFKAEMKNQAQPTASVAQLAGDLQEKFDRVNRKLKNWNLIENAATERFNAAMDAALEALFSRINLGWPSGELPSGASDSSAGAPSTGAYDSLRSRSYSKGGRSEPAHGGEGPSEKSVDHPSNRRRHVPQATGTDDTDEGGYGSPSSSASQRYAWDEELSTTDAEDDGSGGSLRHGGSKGSRNRSTARPGAAGTGQHRGDGRRQTSGPARPSSSGHGRDTARTDPEGKARRVHHQAVDMIGGSTGVCRQPQNVPSAWHVGPTGTYLTAPAPQPVMQPGQQTVAAAPTAAFGTPFPPTSSAWFGSLQPPYASTSTASMAPSSFPAPSSAPTGAVGHAGAHPYSFAFGDIHGLAGPALGKKASDAQDMAKVAGMDVLSGFPFGNSGLWAHLYGGSGMHMNAAHSGVRSGGGANSTLLYRPEHAATSSAVSCMAPSSSLDRNGQPNAAASEVCATTSTGALHSAWQASSTHSNVQGPAHGTQRSSTSGPTAMQMGYDVQELRNGVTAMPYKSVYGNFPATGRQDAQAQALAFAGLGDFIGGASMPNFAAGHMGFTYGGAGSIAPGHERLVPGQYMR